MIKDLEGTANYISNWIKERAQIANAQALIVGISGGVDSALVAALCNRTGLPTVGVMMPCHSSQSSINRGREVIAKFKLISHQVNLDSAFESIERHVASDLNDKYESSFQSKDAQGALRSCLRAPTLDFVGKVYKGIVVGTGNRDEDEVTRYFQKRGDGCVDISPIAKLHKSEVYELSKYLEVPQSVLEATPTADLWGPNSDQTDESQLGMSYKEVEWGIRTADSVGGTRRGHFEKAVLGADLTQRQLEILNTLGKMEEMSRHKENPSLPVCDVRLSHLVG